MNATVSDNSERIARVETRLEYIGAILDDRRTLISAHSRRLADIEMHLRDHHAVNMDQLDRIAKLEATQDIVREERLKRQHTTAMMQWVFTFVIGAGVIVGIITNAESKFLTHVLGGLTGLP